MFAERKKIIFPRTENIRKKTNDCPSHQISQQSGHSKDTIRVPKKKNNGNKNNKKT